MSAYSGNPTTANLRSNAPWDPRVRQDGQQQYQQQPQQQPPRQLRHVQPGRSSLSALDNRHADQLRRDVYAHAFAAEYEGKNNHKSAPIFIPPRKLHHQRRNSASPAATYTNYHENHLRVPPRLRPPVIMARTASAGPGAVPSSYFGAPPELYPMREMTTKDFEVRTQRSSYRTMPRTQQHPALQAPKMDTSRVADTLPTMLNRPRKLSSSSTGSNTSMSSQGFEARMRSSSWSNRTSFESVDTSPYQWRPEYMNQRPSYKSTFRKKARPGELFSALPGEVLELILDELKKSHLGRGSDSCATCWMRDLCSISLSSRKWYKFSRTALYEDVQLIGADSAVHKKRYKLTHGTRMIMLRRTLRSSPHIAAIVHSLKVPAQSAGTSQEEYHNLVATLVMACPNLERLVGLYPQYNHSFTRLVHAMSTRQRLKQMDWIVEASPFQRQHRFKSSLGNGSSMAQPEKEYVTPGDLQPQQSAVFLDHHMNWRYLTSLSIHCLPGATLTPDTLIPTTLSCLPALQHLYVSHLPLTSFNDNSLQSLPALKTLSLSHVPGVTSRGLSSFATLSASQAIRRLTLRHVAIDSLPALARIFSNLIHLETFSLVQSFPPTLPEDTFIWLMPYLASASLRKLHWDITSHPSCANVADSILARSIGADGFPSLRVLRAPNDPEGIFQSLCRPLERIDLASDRFRGLGKGSFSSTNQQYAPLSPTKIPGKSPTSPMFPPDAGAVRDSSDLHKARLAAQARLEASRRFPRYFVNVIDEDGVLIEKYGIAAFIGAAESKINYHLLPDPGAKDESGGLIEVLDLLNDSGENILNKEACSGKWNMPVNGHTDKKEKDKWWHTERGRWTKLELS